MTNHLRTAAYPQAAQSYLEAAFPGHVEAAIDHVIAVSCDDIPHDIVLQPEFYHGVPMMRMPCASVNSPTIYVNPGR
jgi:hypothetical protein